MRSCWSGRGRAVVVWLVSLSEGRRPCEDRGRDWGNASTSHGWPANPQELGERYGTHSPSQPSEGSNLTNTLVLDFQPPEL